MSVLEFDSHRTKYTSPSYLSMFTSFYVSLQWLPWMGLAPGKDELKLEKLLLKGIAECNKHSLKKSGRTHNVIVATYAFSPHPHNLLSLSICHLIVRERALKSTLFA